MNQQILNAQSTALYYAREGLWRTLQNSCNDYYTQYNDPFFKFFKAFALYKENSITEAINELNQIRNKKEVSFACNHALIHYHQSQRNLDRDAINDLKKSLENSQFNEKAYILSGWFFLLNEQIRKASDILNQVIIFLV